MGKRLIQQRRGRGKYRFSSPSHRFQGEIKYIQDNKKLGGTVEELIHDSGRTAPLARVTIGKEKTLMIAPEGIKVGDQLRFTDDKKEMEIGDISTLGKIPEGTPIYNIELAPGDGGKIGRAGGSNATVVAHEKNTTVIQLPSGSFKTLNSSCRATVGVAAGGGRKDKPFMKAGKKYFAYRNRGKQYPVVRGVAMNPVDHPHGGGSHQHVGKPSSVSRSAPPGRKVGNIAPKRTGRR